MTYQIDQSGKIEDTGRNTVLALSNDLEYTIVIPGKVKRQLQELYRKDGLTRVYIYQVFSVGIYFLISRLKLPTHIIIDREYKGKEKLINELVHIFLECNQKPNHYLTFDQIGRNPKVHYLANNVLNQKRKADRIIRIEEILLTLKKTDGRLRECLSILVGARPRSIKRYYHRHNKKSRKIK